MATRPRSTRACTYCPDPGADTCVRTHRDGPHGPGAHIYAHRTCAEKRGAVPLYAFTDTPAPEARR